MLCCAPDCQLGAESWTNCFQIFLHTLAVIAVLSLPDTELSTLAGLSSALLEASNYEHGYHTCIMTNHVVVIMRCSLQLSIWAVAYYKASLPVSCPWHMQAIWTGLRQDSFHEGKLWFKRKCCLFSDSRLRAFGFSLTPVTASLCNHQYLSTQTPSAFISPSPERAVSFTSLPWALMSIYHLKSCQTMSLYYWC